MSDQQYNKSDISSSGNTNADRCYDSLLVELKEVKKDRNTLYLISDGEILESVKVHLYKMFVHFEQLDVVELHSSNAALDLHAVYDNCIRLNKHCCFILGKEAFDLKDIFSRYDKLKEPSNLGNCSSDGKEIHREGRFVSNLDQEIFLNNIIQIGLQLQDTPPTFFEDMDKQYYEHYRIGNFRSDLREAEPIMRDLNLFQFNCNTLKSSEFPSKKDANPSGFTTEEALQLMKYASLSPYLSFLIIHGIESDGLEESSASFLAQAAWYVSHGLDVRMDDSPYQLEDMQEYIADHEFYDFPISFLKSRKSGRWWIKIPNHNDETTPFVCISCSEKDYVDVFENRVPYRLLRAIERNQ